MLFIMWFSPVSCYFPPLSHKYVLQHPILEHSQCVCYCLNVRNQVSQSFQTTDIITVLYILMFMFIDSEWEA